MTMPDLKTIRDLSKGGLAGIVILGYFLLRSDYQDLKETSRDDYNKLSNKCDMLDARLYEQQNTVIKEAIGVMKEFNIINSKKNEQSRTNDPGADIRSRDHVAGDRSN